MGVSSRIGKYVLIIVNIPFAITAAALVIIGIIFYNQFDFLSELISYDPDYVDLVSALAIPIGIIMFFTAFLGCCGAIVQDIKLLRPYAIIVWLSLIAEIGFLIFISIILKQDDGLQKFISEKVTELFESVDERGIEIQMVDFLQMKLNCCEAKPKKDWPQTSRYKRLQPSCCGEYTKDCRIKDAYSTGCSDAVYSWIETNEIYITIAIVILIIIEFVCGFMSIWQMWLIKRNRRNKTDSIPLT